MRIAPMSSVFSRLSFNAAGIALALVGFSLPADAETAFMKLPPPVYGGLVKDYMQRPYGSSPSVSIYVRRVSDGKLLVSTKTVTAQEDVNYSAKIPMISAPSDGIVGLRYGETASFSMLDGDVLWRDLVRVTPEKSGYRRLDITLGHDENGDGIADEYAAYMLLKMKEYGIAGEAFDPEADYNRDGVSNREHYLAATNPFAGLAVGGEVIAEQACTISSLMNVRSYSGDEYFAITFNALEEASYSVLALDDLSKGWGAAQEVASREQPDGIDAEVEHWPETSGEMTLYVPRDAKVRQRFYKLVVGSW